MKARVALQLGRVSNLPTVWSNTAAGLTLAGVGFSLTHYLQIALAMSLMYVAGMFFNDVFDADFDARHRPQRAIPSGQVQRVEVIWWGSVMLLLAIALAAVPFQFPLSINLPALLAALMLASLVLWYDWRHKGNALAPWIMGSCRGMVYLTALLSLSSVLPSQALPAVGGIILWVVGLTLVAKKQALPGLILLLLALNLLLYVFIAPVFSGILTLGLAVLGSGATLWVVYRARWGQFYNPVTLLIAAISLIDALVIAGVRQQVDFLVMATASCMALTLLMQRWIEGS